MELAGSVLDLVALVLLHVRAVSFDLTGHFPLHFRGDLWELAGCFLEAYDLVDPYHVRAFNLASSLPLQFSVARQCARARGLMRLVQQAWASAGGFDDVFELAGSLLRLVQQAWANVGFCASTTCSSSRARGPTWASAGGFDDVLLQLVQHAWANVGFCTT